MVFAKKTLHKNMTRLAGTQKMVIAVGQRNNFFIIFGSNEERNSVEKTNVPMGPNACKTTGFGFNKN